MLFGFREGIGFLQVTSKGLLVKLVYSRCLTCVGIFMLYFKAFVLHSVFNRGTRETFIVVIEKVDKRDL